MAKRKTKNFGQGMQDEVSRQLQSRFVRSSPGREIYMVYTRLKSGAWLQPRYIIGALVSLVALLAVGCVGALGVVGAWFGLNM